MAARKRAQEHDFNRRRRLILDKGMDMAYNQKGTALGDCLLKWNVREETLLQRRHRLLQKQGDISVGFKEQEKKLFVVTRDQATREPTLLLERTPSAEQYPGYVDVNQPRYMRPLNTRQSKTPEFSTFSVFQAVKKRKRNPWEEAVKETVQFRPTLCPCARLNQQDAEKLLMDWAAVNEKQTKALGLKTDNRSAPIKHIRTGLNPLNLPPRLNSQLHHLAHDLLEDISTDVSSEDEADDSGDSIGLPPEDLSDEDEDDRQQQQVFVTQLPQKSTAPSRASQTSQSQRPQQQLSQQRRQPHQSQPQHPQQELVVFEVKDNSQKEKQLARKHQLDGALINIYDLLDRRRVAGRPRVRNAPDTRANITYAHRQQSRSTGRDSISASTSIGATPSRMSSVTLNTASTAPAAGRVPMMQQLMQYGQHHPQQLFRSTTCRTAESIRILAESRRRRQRNPTMMRNEAEKEVSEQAPSEKADED